MTDPSPRLSIRNLSIGNKQAFVRGVSFDVQPGQVLALVGESGSGKTLIGRSILRLLPEHIRQLGGAIRYHGRDLSGLPNLELRKLRGGRIGMVFQEPLVSLNPALSIGLQMAEGLKLHLKLRPDEIRRRCIEMLERIHVPRPEQCLAAYPHQFSGGMRQRIMLASVMLLRPDLLIADEPTTALDTLSQRQVIETMLELTREVGTSVLLITHNLGLVANCADSAIVLHRGEIVEGGSASAVIQRPQHAYTRALVDALPRRREEGGSAPTGEPLLVGKGLELSFRAAGRSLLRRKRIRVLQGVSLTIHRGETVAVVGGSGSGKTTLGRALLRLIDVDRGTIAYRGADVTRQPDRQLRSFRRACQIVFQDPFSSLDPRMKVGALVGEALRYADALDRAERQNKIEAALADVGLPGHADRLPHQLSGGQRQRVALARAIVGGPDLLVADEPIASLDMTVQKQVLELFRRLQAERGFACLFISHDLAAVQQIADRIVVMHEGRIVEEGPTASIFHAPRHDYTRRLLEASPLLDAPPHAPCPQTILSEAHP
ncbi:dipeptide ABC transporter ATP-binding protein [Reyranella sp.]|uniref:dipeptide ABC transporter ATP-binding protein n=1 Tax=Reyranella sp. TaxID=1929291 RepID=UPI003783B3D7